MAAGCGPGRTNPDGGGPDYRCSADAERGPDSFDTTLRGVRWLVAHAFHISVAGRTLWDEEEVAAREGYRRLFTAEAMPVDANDPNDLVLFPEMDATVDVPEITSDCWNILDVDPNAMMCATSRMVVKRKGAETRQLSLVRSYPTSRNSNSGAPSRSRSTR